MGTADAGAREAWRGIRGRGFRRHHGSVSGAPLPPGAFLVYTFPEVVTVMVPVFISSGGPVYAVVGILFTLALVWGVLMLLGSGVESLFSERRRKIRKIEREGRRLARESRRRMREIDAERDELMRKAVPPTDAPPEGRHFAD